MDAPAPWGPRDGSRPAPERNDTRRWAPRRSATFIACAALLLWTFVVFGLRALAGGG